MCVEWGYHTKGGLVRSVNRAQSCGFDATERKNSRTNVVEWYRDETPLRGVRQAGGSIRQRPQGASGSPRFLRSRGSGERLTRGPTAARLERAAIFHESFCRERAPEALASVQKVSIR
jgi:hypothetical protein